MNRKHAWVSGVVLCIFCSLCSAQKSGTLPQNMPPPLPPAPSSGFGSAGSNSATDAGGSNAPIVYMAQQEFAENIIRNLAYAQGLALGPNLSARARQAQVSGKLVAAKLTDLLEQLGRRHGFDHFIHGATIYLYDPTDWRTETIPVSFRPDDNFRENLSHYGLLFPNFRLLTKPDEQAVVVTAPRQYIALLERSLRSHKEIPQAEMLVFRLRHAAADDRVVVLRERQYVTPGVVSILRGLMGDANGGDAPAAGGARNGVPGNLAGGAAISPMSAMGGLAGGTASIVPDPYASQGVGAAGGVTAGAGGLPAGRAVQLASGAQGQAAGSFIQADVRTNSVIIRDRRNKESEWRRLIEQLDVPQEMVEIEAVLIDIDQRRLDQLGVQWSARNNTLSMQFPSSGVDGNPMVQGSTALITDRGRFAARLQALIADNDARVLARPTILTHNNLSGVIDLTQTYFTRVTGERVANLVPVVAGSLLRVTPRIILPERDIGPAQVQLSIEIEDGTLKDRAGLELPTVQKNSLTTQASILADQAILIGGYTRETEETLQYKVPVLGDLPVVGALMRSRTKTAQTMTRLFLITPRLVSVMQSGVLKPAVDRRLELKRTDAMQNLLPPLQPGPAAPKPRAANAQSRGGMTDTLSLPESPEAFPVMPR